MSTVSTSTVSTAPRLDILPTLDIMISISADFKDLDLDSFNLVDIELCCMIYNVSVFTCGHPVGI